MALTKIGAYEIERRIATGGMAEVYLAKRKGPYGFAKRVALKQILPQYAQDNEFVSLFIEEARTAARLEHPSIVQVFDFGEEQGHLYLAMEFVDGTQVNKLLRTVHSRRETVPLESALFIAKQTADALSYLHEACDDDGKHLGLIHRDVSPANILLSRDGRIKLSDFGIIRLNSADRYTGAGKVRGKPGYMSPEQVMGLPLTPKSDVFTLSIVLAEMLLGRPLFNGGDDIEVLLRIRNADISALENTSRTIPKDVKSLIKAGLTHDPEQRPSAGEYAKALEISLRTRDPKAESAHALTRLLERLELITVGQDQEPHRKRNTRPTWLVQFESSEVNRTQTIPSPTDVSVYGSPGYRLQLSATSPFIEVNFPELVQLITTGHVNGRTPISVNDAPPQPAEKISELARFVTSPALHWNDEIILTQSHERGGIDYGKLFEIAHKLAIGRETGMLYLHHQARRKKIYFVDGRPEFVASTDPKEMFGQFLVDTGVCDQQQLGLALDVLPHYGGRMGDALVGQGVIRPSQLFHAVVRQFRHRYLEAFRWGEGEWAFVRGVVSQEEALPLGQSTHELMRDAAISLNSAELESATKPLANKILKVNNEPSVPLHVFHLPKPWEDMLLRTPSGVSFEKICAQECERAELSKDDIARTVLLGTSSKWLIAE